MPHATHPLAIPAPPTPLEQLDPVRLVVAGFLARYSGRTRDAYSQDVACYLGWCAQVGLNPLSATRPHLELYARWMEEHRRYAPATVARRIGTLNILYRYAVLDGHLTQNPVDYVRRPVVHLEAQRRTVLHALEYAAFLTAARDAGTTEHAVAALLGMLGLRVSEATAADVTDLGVEQGYEVLHIIGKGGKPATVPLPIPALRAIRSAAAGRTAGPLLLNRDGRRMDRKAVARVVTRIAKAAGITHDITPHGLRRTFCTTGLATGIPLRDMQNAMRHSDSRSTERYDMRRTNLDRHASHAIAAFLAGMAS